MSVTEIFPDVVPLEDDLANIVFTGLDQGMYHGVEIGRGSQGSVSRIKVEDQRLDVAVKSILMSQMESLSQLDRLEREAAVLQSLPNHPGVARYLGYRTREIPRTGSIDTEYSILMEYVNGDPLSVASGKPIDDSTILVYCDQMYDILGFLHSHNIIHRDIKPSNVMRQKDGKIKLIDFGLVKKTDWTTMTASRGAFLGSLNYAAPEIEDGKLVTAAADLYSLAVMLTVLKRGKEFSYRDRPDDIRAAAKEMHFDKPELKERLEAMLTDNPEERMERVRLVDGKYVFPEAVRNLDVKIEKKDQRIDFVELPLAVPVQKYTLGNAMKYSVKFLSFFGGSASFHFVIPTTIRRCDASSIDPEMTLTEGVTSLVSGMFGAIGTVIYTIESGNWKYVIPTFVVTNLGSFLYENIREKKSLSKKEQHLLEDKVAAATPAYSLPRNAQDLYARIGTVNKKEEQSLSAEECLKLKAERGAKKFKRKVLGLFGLKKSKDLEEMVSIFYDLGMVSSREEGREVLSYLRGLQRYDRTTAIHIEEVETAYGKKKYRIKTFDEGSHF